MCPEAKRIIENLKTVESLIINNFLEVTNVEPNNVSTSQVNEEVYAKP
jgi:hypothetical protein